MQKSITFIFLAAFAEVVGNLLLKSGMAELGDVSLLELSEIYPFLVRVISNAKICLGIVCLIIFFALWLMVLSWEELSVALPLQAMVFILTPLSAQLLLDESIPPLRWLGILLITIGIVLVTISPKSVFIKNTTPPVL